jgi:hypothetical protein
MTQANRKILHFRLWGKKYKIKEIFFLTDKFNNGNTAIMGFSGGNTR